MGGILRWPKGGLAEDNTWGTGALDCGLWLKLPGKPQACREPWGRDGSRGHGFSWDDVGKWQRMLPSFQPEQLEFGRMIKKDNKQGEEAKKVIWEILKEILKRLLNSEVRGREFEICIGTSGEQFLPVI